MTDEDQKTKINQLQMFEQSLQNILVQKQQFQSQQVEIDSALEQIKKTDTSYKIVANIMIKTDKGDVEKDLKSKKEMLDLRIKTLEKQENQIREKAQKIQSEVLEGMEDKKE